MAIFNALQLYYAADQVIQFVFTPPTVITGWNFEFNLRTGFDDPIAFNGGIVPSTTNGQIVVTDSINGVGSISLSLAQMTLAAGPGDYFFDLQRIDVGFQRPVARGTCQVLATYGMP